MQHKYTKIDDKQQGVVVSMNVTDYIPNILCNHMTRDNGVYHSTTIGKWFKNSGCCQPS